MGLVLLHLSPGQLFAATHALFEQRRSHPFLVRSLRRRARWVSEVERRDDPAIQVFRLIGVGCDRSMRRGPPRSSPSVHSLPWRGRSGVESCATVLLAHRPGFKMFDVLPCAALLPGGARPVSTARTSRRRGAPATILPNELVQQWRLPLHGGRAA
ncbi:hypothetical protein BCR35DRAFT_198208 [Leucosporidium creatinivorum]|uniref:Uncharacterized protein n=1 Tax=Leucosporidium creatinivorum TaxID=106004 RepID=A0A1Y2DML0_9BASI|nr:hypothetical protein BCR35DRAFT_198208 [Leucosporidium creatinivorum]